MKLVFSFLLLFIALNSLGQHTKVAYTLSFAKDTLNPDVISEESFYLFSSNDKSYFTSALAYQLDTLMTEGKKRTTQVGLLRKKYRALPKSQFKFYLQKDFSLNNFLFVEKFTSEIGLEYKLPSLNWELVDSTKNIGGYSCQKAILIKKGLHYSAWFTDEIEVYDGPYLFSGLPGLIMQLSCLEKVYSFRFSGVEILEKGILAVPKLEAITYTKAKFLALRENWKRYSISNDVNSGKIKFANGTDGLDMVKELDLENYEKYKTNNFEFELF